ncbi:hypothetical protein [Streptomyces massasporeus]|uniref:hypothetical protein n=1 Tax=Streptomyces massasporeus TaxID=67324 RepID=UPI0036BEEF5F
MAVDDLRPSVHRWGTPARCVRHQRLHGPPLPPRALDLDEEATELFLAGNARRVFNL